jgi:hypothetical protein
VPLVNQNYALISCELSDALDRNSSMALRIYGTFATIKEANECAEEAIQKGYTDVVDIHHGFFPLPTTDDKDVETCRYNDDLLQDIMTGYKTKLDSSNVCLEKSAEAKINNETASDEFERLVAKESLKLFKEWKAQGKVDSRSKINAKLKKRHTVLSRSYNKNWLMRLINRAKY